MKFRADCRATKKRGNGVSVTGVSYLMVRLWTDEVIDKVYKLLIRMWESKSIPEFMKYKWMVLVPKVVGSLRKEDYRPLSMIEILRKIWMGHFMGVLNGIIFNYQLFMSAHNGCLKQRWTDSATICVTNSMELSEELEITIAADS